MLFLKFLKFLKPKDILFSVLIKLFLPSTGPLESLNLKELDMYSCHCFRVLTAVENSLIVEHSVSSIHFLKAFYLSSKEESFLISKNCCFNIYAYFNIGESSNAYRRLSASLSFNLEISFIKACLMFLKYIFSLLLVFLQRLSLS